MTHSTRRRFLKTLASSGGMLVAARRAEGRLRPARALAFRHLHTGESLTLEPSAHGAFHADALAAVNHLLRDFRTGDVHPIDPQLLALLTGVAATLDTPRPFEVISGYRSPRTNASLRRASDGVAARSLHMVGQAIDVRVSGVALVALRDACLDQRAGGVGYYPASNFVHLDTGRIRRW